MGRIWDDLEWEEKWQIFSDRFYAGKVSEDLYNYIPLKYWDAIYHVNVDEDGYWVWLKSGYRAYDHAEDCGYIREFRICDIKGALKGIEYRKEWEQI